MSPKGPLEVFQVVKEGEGYKLEMNETALGVNNKMTSYARSRIDGIDKLLTTMSKQVKKADNLSAKEEKALWHALKHKWEAELEASVPSGFRKAYEATDSWKEAADMITNGLFSRLNQSIGSTLTKYAEIVDSEIVTGGASKGEMKDILSKMAVSATPKEVEALWAHHERKAGKSKRDRTVKENALALGRRAIKERRHR